MKIKLLAVLLLILVSCSKEEVPICNCQVIGNDSFKEVSENGGIYSSLPVQIIPYDTVVNCDQDGVSWYIITETIEPPKTITKTSFRKIKCNE